MGKCRLWVNVAWVYVAMGICRMGICRLTTSSLAGRGMEQVSEHGSGTLDRRAPPQNIPLVKTRRQMGE